ncbi:DUF2933 domain-containing protein [Massilia sp. PAMC28688]|uniref:DUF2933 domain-containing protein n=1 Tax=Massilia sp. PAMC28688 TaxID=2861283 RepID=UPI001C6335C8|nr:DUF2933 domain-containing protein [Massilia sp. PAMC28688]QYF92983.1 DUF2933 domain-containing protein [Massilia sp. PAMC28688]
MRHHVDSAAPAGWPDVRQWVAAAAFLLLAAYLWFAHEAYLFALLPLALGLVCPLVHLFHRGHGSREGGRQP